MYTVIDLSFFFLLLNFFKCAYHTSNMYIDRKRKYNKKRQDNKNSITFISRDDILYRKRLSIQSKSYQNRVNSIK